MYLLITVFLSSESELYFFLFIFPLLIFVLLSLYFSFVRNRTIKDTSVITIKRLPKEWWFKKFIWRILCFIVQGRDEHLWGKRGLQGVKRFETNLMVGKMFLLVCLAHLQMRVPTGTAAAPSPRPTAHRPKDVKGTQQWPRVGAAWLTLIAAGSETGPQSPRGEAKWRNERAALDSPQIK